MFPLSNTRCQPPPTVSTPLGRANRPDHCSKSSICRCLCATSQSNPQPLNANATLCDIMRHFFGWFIKILFIVVTPHNTGVYADHFDAFPFEVSHGGLGGVEKGDRRGTRAFLKGRDFNSGCLHDRARFRAIRGMGLQPMCLGNPRRRVVLRPRSTERSDLFIPESSRKSGIKERFASGDSDGVPSDVPEYRNTWVVNPCHVGA